MEHEYCAPVHYDLPTIKKAFLLAVLSWLLLIVLNTAFAPVLCTIWLVGIPVAPFVAYYFTEGYGMGETCAWWLVAPFLMMLWAFASVIMVPLMFFKYMDEQKHHRKLNKEQQGSIL